MNATALPHAAAGQAISAGGLLRPAAPAMPGRTGGITPAMRRAAQDFEAQALSQLLAPAFATVDMSRSAFGGGQAEAQWRPMLLDAMAGAAARGGRGIGLADHVLAAMLQRQSQTQPAAEAGTAQEGIAP